MQFVGPKIRFQCILCGECCRRYWITVNLDDLARIYSRLGLLPSQVSALYPKTVAGGWDYPSLQVEGGEYYLVLRKKLDGACIFTKWEGGRLACSIHDYRPLSCRYYPFIYRAEGIASFELFSGAVGYCPGVGRGNYHDLSGEASVVESSMAARRRFEEFARRWNEGGGAGRSIAEFMRSLDGEVVRLTPALAGPLRNDGGQQAEQGGNGVTHY